MGTSLPSNRGAGWLSCGNKSKILVNFVVSKLRVEDKYGILKNKRDDRTPFMLNAKRPLIISGPCSAETQQQTIQTAQQLAATGMVDVLRAGVWKPRTSPDTFEGVGEIGLNWLSQARELTGLPIAVEVAVPKHIESALNYGVDMIWIGARTTVSPFAIQELASALNGVKEIAVLIKNPVNPDIGLWSGAVSRFVNAGLDSKNIGLIHRGFSYFGHTKYRNAPMWHIALQMRNLFPELTMICDPSHISGNRDYLYQVSQTAADLRYDGLIIESHISPNDALSDSGQQITPLELNNLLRKTQWRTDRSDNPKFVESLDLLRNEIDQIDAELFELLGRRMAVSEKIGVVKHQNNVAILQSERWSAIVTRILDDAEHLNLNEDFIRAILELIHLESINHQNRVMNR